MGKLVSDAVDKPIDKIKKEKSYFPTKVVIRRMPPSLTKDAFLKEIGDLPDHDYFAFFHSDMSIGYTGFTRAYINFKDYLDVLDFRNNFDGYAFYDAHGREYAAVVELAPCQLIPKERKKKDHKCSTIEKDADYIHFLQQLDEEEEKLPSAEIYIEEMEAMKAIDKNKEKIVTPLIEFLQEKRDSRIAARQAAVLQREKEKSARIEKEKEKKKEREERERERKLKIEERKENNNQRRSNDTPQQPQPQPPPQPPQPQQAPYKRSPEKSYRETRKGGGEFKKDTSEGNDNYTGNSKRYSEEKPRGDTMKEKEKDDKHHAPDRFDKEKPLKEFLDKKKPYDKFRDKDQRDKDQRDKDQRDKDFRDKDFRGKDNREKDNRDKDRDKDRDREYREKGEYRDKDPRDKDTWDKDHRGDSGCRGGADGEFEKEFRGSGDQRSGDRDSASDRDSKPSPREKKGAARDKDKATNKDYREKERPSDRYKRYSEKGPRYQDKERYREDREPRPRYNEREKEGGGGGGKAGKDRGGGSGGGKSEQYEPKYNKDNEKPRDRKEKDLHAKDKQDTERTRKPSDDKFALEERRPSVEFEDPSIVSVTGQAKDSRKDYGGPGRTSPDKSSRKPRPEIKIYRPPSERGGTQVERKKSNDSMKKSISKDKFDYDDRDSDKEMREKPSKPASRSSSTRDRYRDRDSEREEDSGRPYSSSGNKPKYGRGDRRDDRYDSRESVDRVENRRKPAERRGNRFEREKESRYNRDKDRDRWDYEKENKSRDGKFDKPERFGGSGGGGSGGGKSTVEDKRSGIEKPSSDKKIGKSSADVITELDRERQREKEEEQERYRRNWLGKE